MRLRMAVCRVRMRVTLLRLRLRMSARVWPSAAKSSGRKAWQRTFECKIRYEKTMENGMNKKVTEPYLVDALSFTEAEARIIEAVSYTHLVYRLQEERCRRNHRSILRIRPRQQKRHARR